MMQITSLLLALLLVSVTLSLHAQTLDGLQQSFDKAVSEKATAPYRAAVAELNRKYSAAIDRLTTAATQAGDLDTALILREEKSRLLPEGTLPEDTESTPAALKAARATYRQQVAALQSARDAATQPLKQHFITLLQGLLTQTTQAGKLDEALTLREKIASLSSKTDPAPPGTSPSKPASPPAGSSRLITAKSTGKTDPEAARQIITWALANDATVTTNLGIIGEKEKLTASPPGKFSVTELSLNSVLDDFPWTALTGLGELQKLIFHTDFELTANHTRYFANLGDLRFLKIKNASEAGLQAMPILPKIFEVEVNNPSPEFVNLLHLLQERTASAETITATAIATSDIADAFCSKLAGWPQFRKLHGSTWITATRADYLAALPKFEALAVMTGTKIESGLLPSFKNLLAFASNSAQPPAILQELTTLPKLFRITLDLEKMSPADIPDFNASKALTEVHLENSPTPAAEVVAKCNGITGMKIFKLVFTQIDPATITALLSFKNLEVLSLNDCKFTPDAFTALPQLKALKNLKELNLKNSGIPPADLAALKRALPKTLIRNQ